MRLWGIAAVIVACGAGVLTFFVRRGPTVVAPQKALSWSRATPDAGAREVIATWFGVDFMRLEDANEPILEFGALRRGEEWIVLDELNCFDEFVPVDGGVWVLGQWCTEGGGPSAELLFLATDGRATHVVTLPKPVYWATLRGLEVNGETLTVTIEQDSGEGPIALPDEWVFAPWRVEPLTRFRPDVGPYATVTSKNGGRTWRLDRHAPPP